MQQIGQKNYKTRHDWEKEIIHWELCKKFEFNHLNKLYIHNPEYVLENRTNKISDFEIQTEQKISARRPDLLIV